MVPQSNGLADRFRPHRFIANPRERNLRAAGMRVPGQSCTPAVHSCSSDPPL